MGDAAQGQPGMGQQGQGQPGQPAAGADQQHPQGQAGQPAAGTAQAVGVDGKFGQADVDRIVAQRLQRAEQTWLQKADEALAKVGVKGGLAGLDQHLQQQTEAQKAALASTNQYQTLYEQEKAEKARLLAEKDAEVKTLKAQRESDHIDRELLKASTKAISPDQVATLLRGRVRFDPQTSTTYTVDEMGNRLTDGKGEYLSVDDLVDAFLAKNPHFQRAAGGQGAGGQQNGRPPASGMGGGGPDASLGFDPGQLSDVEYAIKNQDKVRAAILAGKVI